MSQQAQNSNTQLYSIDQNIPRSVSKESGDCYYISKRDNSSGCTYRKISSNAGLQCKTNIKYCKKDSGVYHKLCDRYWNITDEQIGGMSEVDITKAIEDLEVCIYMRERHIEVCVAKECQDRSHREAINKLKKKMEKIKTQKRTTKLDIKRPEDSIPTDTTASFILPQLPIRNREVDLVNYVESINRNIGSGDIKIYPPDKIVNEYMVSIELRSKREGGTTSEVIGMGESMYDAYLNLADHIVDSYADDVYLERYNKLFGY